MTTKTISKTEMLRRVERWLSGYGTKTQSQMRDEVRAFLKEARNA